MKNKYFYKAQELNIPLFTGEELVQEKTLLSEFFDDVCLKKIEKVLEKFKNVYEIFDKGNRKFVAENEFEEAALADLRYEMESLFYVIRDNYPGENTRERQAFENALRVIISIFVCVPTIIVDRAKDEILDYTLRK